MKAALSSLLFLGATLAMAFSPKAEPPSLLIWDTLEKVRPEKKETFPALESLFATEVSVGGYILANEFSENELTEFILTHYGGGCIHVPLPPANSMIHVVMANGKRAKPLFNKRVVVHGKLRFGSRVDSVYEMLADSVQELPYE